MKALVISDIHGEKTNLDKVKETYLKNNCQKLIVLGDLYLNKNPNNDPSGVREFLKEFSKTIICIKGNCDVGIDFDKEPFPIEKDNVVNIIDNIYITHGHIYNENNWPLNNSILIFGHYHIPFIKKIDTNIYINSGSISTPKSDNSPSYLLIDDNTFTIYDVNGVVIDSIKINY